MSKNAILRGPRPSLGFTAKRYQIPKGWRQLLPGEVIEATDKFSHCDTGRWVYYDSYEAKKDTTDASIGAEVDAEMNPVIRLLPKPLKR